MIADNYSGMRLLRTPLRTGMRWGHWVLVAVCCWVLLPPLHASNSLFYQFYVDTSGPEFTKCTPIEANLTASSPSKALIYCVARCSQAGACKFAFLNGETCVMHSVVLASGMNTTNTGAVEAYRPSSESTPYVDISSTATVTATTDFSGFPTFSASLLQGDSWCWIAVSDCPCTIDSKNQNVKINLNSARYIRKMRVYPTVPAYTSLSTHLQIYVGNTGSITTDPLLVDDQNSYGRQEYYRSYKVNLTAQYITFYKNTGANICLCKVFIYD
ncbi:uncharacterized protein [Procambarus clarkii]|uniref:uncharacterized protein n=1 Tax=Procambarus clarkii TaxID=6728 RepID=UPI001E67119B|nr:uncharacterized protein LOC123764451 [Procambarus clarkii]